MGAVWNFEARCELFEATASHFGQLQATSGSKGLGMAQPRRDEAILEEIILKEAEDFVGQIRFGLNAVSSHQVLHGRLHLSACLVARSHFGSTQSGLMKVRSLTRFGWHRAFRLRDKRWLISLFVCFLGGSFFLPLFLRLSKLQYCRNPKTVGGDFHSSTVEKQHTYYLPVP